MGCVGNYIYQYLVQILLKVSYIIKPPQLSLVAPTGQTVNDRKKFFLICNIASPLFTCVTVCEAVAYRAVAQFFNIACLYSLSYSCLTIATSSEAYPQHRAFSQEQHHPTITLGIHLYLQSQKFSQHCSRHSCNPRSGAPTLTLPHSVACPGFISSFATPSTAFVAHILFTAPFADGCTRA